MNSGQSLTLEEILVSPSEIMESQLSINRSEVRKSKSKMRTYLKKCKDVFISPQQQAEDIRPISTQDNVSSSCTSWYLDNDFAETKSGAQSINFEQPADKIDIENKESKMSTILEISGTEVKS